MVRPRSKAVLTKLELLVMKVVWEAEPAPITVREVAAHLNAQLSRPLAYNTVQTVLTILKDKGIVRARSGGGRAHEYCARISQDDITTSMIGDLVERLFDGRLSPLLLNLVGDESLSRSDLERIRGVIDERLSDEESRP